LGKRFAMTIGELLVTMTIIGVIAILVLPSFIKDYQKKVYVTRLKKVYEMLDNAVNQASNDNNVSYFGQTPYASGAKADAQAFIDKYFKKASGTITMPFASSYKVLSTGETPTFGMDEESTGFAKLAGGEAVAFMCTAGHCIFKVDINAKDGPNIGGRDLFMLMIDKNDNELYDAYSSATCGTSQYGYGCLRKIMEDNWEMKY